MKILGALLCAILLASAGDAHAITSYFAGSDVESDTVEMFPKWTDMMHRYHDEEHTLDDVCGKEDYSVCKLKEWKEFVGSLRGKPLMEQMNAINRFANRYPYIEDIVNWGVEDYWATVYEFQRKSGDCEDYAIAKYASLRALGVDEDDMRIVVLQDLNLGGVIHAVLMVKTGGRDYILDNQIKQVMPAKDIYHYKPIYSINEKHWWRHIVSAPE